MDSEDDPKPCVEKLAFDTKKQAQAAATSAAYLRGAKVRPYKCQHCGLWHLSTDYEA